MFKKAKWKYNVQEPATNTVVAKLVRLLKSWIFHCLLLLNNGGYIVQVFVCTGTQTSEISYSSIYLPNAVDAEIFEDCHIFDFVCFLNTFVLLLYSLYNL